MDIDRTGAWTTCFLTRMLILYLERIGKGDDLDYHQICEKRDPEEIGEPKAFLKNYNNWVPHSILKSLIQAAEKASGEKEITYLAAKNYFRLNYVPSLLEIIAKLQNSMEQALYSSNLWAAGFANYFKLQCLLPAEGGRSEAILLSQFGSSVEPILGNFQFIRGNYEGFIHLFDYIESAKCIEEISQFRLESLPAEFGNYHIQKSEERLSIIETASGKEIISARKVYLKSERFPSMLEDPISSEGVVLFPENGELRVLAPSVDERLQNRSAEHEAYEITKEGTLVAGPLAFTFGKGRFFNAPYSRYRFSWKLKEKEDEAPDKQDPRARIIPLLFNHIRELRETHHQLRRRAIENRAIAQANEALRKAFQTKSGPPQMFHEAVEDYKRSIIEEALLKTGGDETSAAALLGLQRADLALLIGALDIQRPKSPTPE